MINIKIKECILIITILMTLSNKLNSQTISNGIKVNKYGLMHSHSLRYNINTSYYTDKNVIQIGFEYSNFIDGANPNIEQFTPTIGMLLNNEVSIELETNFLKNKNSSLNGTYFNVGFRLNTEYNISYDIKIGQSFLQIGILYTIDIKKGFSKIRRLL